MADNTISFKVEGDSRVYSIDVDQTHVSEKATSNDVFIRDYIFVRSWNVMIILTIKSRKLNEKMRIGSFKF